MKTDNNDNVQENGLDTMLELGDTISTEQVEFNVEEFEKKQKQAQKKEVVVVTPKVETLKKKPKKKKLYPIISFEKDFYDAGQITEGDVIRHSYKFTNTGKAPLEVTKAVGTCGCTKPSYPFLDIPPGDTGIISVEYHSVGKNGLQDPEIYVYSNASNEKYVLKMQVDVVDKIENISEKQDSLIEVKN